MAFHYSQNKDQALNKASEIWILSLYSVVMLAFFSVPQNQSVLFLLPKSLSLVLFA